MAPPVCEAAAAAAAATATAAPAEVDDEPRLARAPPPPVADRGAVVVALPLPPPPCYNNDSTKEQNVIDPYNSVPAVILHTQRIFASYKRDTRDRERERGKKYVWNALARTQRKTDKSCRCRRRRCTTGWHESAEPGKRVKNITRKREERTNELKGEE